MKTSEQTKELFSALAKAQGEFFEIKKNCTAKVEGVTASGKEYKYEYKYADLSDVLKATMPALSKNGLSIMQGPSPDTKLMLTRLAHSSGEWIETEYPIISKSGKFGLDMQGYGAGFTFARRYAINGILGISSEEDTDGESQKPSEGSAEPDPKPKQPDPKQKKDQSVFMTDPRIKLLYALAKEAGWSEDHLRKFVKHRFGLESNRLLNKEQFELSIAHLKTKPGPFDEPKQ